MIPLMENDWVGSERYPIDPETGEHVPFGNPRQMDLKTLMLWVRHITKSFEHPDPNDPNSFRWKGQVLRNLQGDGGEQGSVGRATSSPGRRSTAAATASLPSVERGDEYSETSFSGGNDYDFGTSSGDEEENPPPEEDQRRGRPLRHTIRDMSFDRNPSAEAPPRSWPPRRSSGHDAVGPFVRGIATVPDVIRLEIETSQSSDVAPVATEGSVLKEICLTPSLQPIVLDNEVSVWAFDGHSEPNEPPDHSQNTCIHGKRRRYP